MPVSTVALPSPVHSATTSAGQVMVGAVVSWMVTDVEQLAVLPAASVAVRSMLDVPTGKVPAPVGPLTVATPQSSVALTLAGVTMPDRMPVHSAVTAGGQLSTGATVSTTVTVWVQLWVLPA